MLMNYNKITKILKYIKTHDTWLFLILERFCFLSTVQRYKPVSIGALKTLGVVSISCGYKHTAVLTQVNQNILRYIYILAIPCGLWDLNSSIKDQTWAPGSENTESQPLDHQGIPILLFFLSPRETVTVRYVY